MTEAEETIKILDIIGQRGTAAMLGSTKYWYVQISSTPNSSYMMIPAQRVVYIEGVFGFGDSYGVIDRRRRGFEMLEALAEYPHVAAKLAEPIK
jgi:hypothetical protein